MSMTITKIFFTVCHHFFPQASVSGVEPANVVAVVNVVLQVAWRSFQLKRRISANRIIDGTHSPVVLANTVRRSFSVPMCVSETIPL